MSQSKLNIRLSKKIRWGVSFSSTGNIYQYTVWYNYSLTQRSVGAVSGRGGPNPRQGTEPFDDSIVSLIASIDEAIGKNLLIRFFISSSDPSQWIRNQKII